MRNFRVFFILTLLVVGAANSRAQHNLQMDDGHGHVSILQGQTVDAADIFMLPTGGGTLLTVPTPGLPSLVWQTAGNVLSAGQIFGSLNALDVVMEANNVEKLRLISGGGVKVSGQLIVNAGPNGFKYVDGNQTAGWFLTEDATGQASWANPATNLVTTATGTSPITVNGDNAAHSGPITIAVTTGNVTSGGSLTIGGTGKTVGSALTADLNLGHANTWTAVQTFPLLSITNGELANSTIAIGSTGSTLTVTGSPISLGGAAGNVDLNLNHANTWTATQTFPAGSLTNAELANSTIALSSSGSLTVTGSPISLGGAGTVNLNLANANTWTAIQTFPAGSITNTELANSTIALSSSGSLTVTGSPISLGGAGTVNLNLGNANTWTAIQTFPAGSITNTELANSSINFTYGTGINGPASVALGGTANFTNTGVTSLAFTGGTLYGNIGAATGAVNLTPVLNTQAANTIFSGPMTGAAAAPTFRTMVLADLPGSGAITVTGGTGLGVSGSPVSLGGTLTLSNTGVTSNIAGTGISVSGATGAVTIGNTGILGITGSGAGINVTAGQNPVVTNTGVTSLAFTGGTLYGNIVAATGAVTLAPALNTQTANTIFSGPTTGAAAAPTFRAMVSADIPAGIVANTSLANSTIALSSSGSLTVTGSPISLGGAGTVNLNLANANNWTGTQTITGAGKFVYVDGNQTAGNILTENGTGVASWVSPSTLAIVSTATGTAPITVNGDNAAHSGAITIALTQGSLTTSTPSITVGGTGKTVGSNITVDLTTGSVTSSGSITVGGTGKTVGANITADLNTANANTWTGTQTFGGEAHTSANSALGAGPTVTDFALGAANSYYRISSTANVALNGLQNGATGRTVTLQNVGAFTITLKSGAGAPAADGFDLPGGADIILGPKGAVTLIYDGTLSLWEVVSTN